MANKKSSKKDIRRIAKRTVANKATRTSLKTYIKKVRTAVDAKDAANVTDALRLAQKSLDKAVKRGIIHKNQASRRLSRIAAAAKKVS
jgi:small subunit ribosomal protein S20